LVTGAGGVFKQVLIDSGVGTLLGESFANTALPPIVLAYLIAVIVRVTQGSATVAMITAAGLISPVIEQFMLNDIDKSLIVLAIASGATFFSHVNDSGFWLVGKYFGLNEKDTIRSWSVMETIISVCGFSLAFILSLIL
jgi:Gnt-I system low-affinity gluconate transporter